MKVINKLESFDPYLVAEIDRNDNLLYFNFIDYFTLKKHNLNIITKN
jgi:hypothetical protein